MTLQNTGLTNGGLTTNFQVQYQDTFYTSLSGAQATQVQNNLIANANVLLSLVEAAFTTSTGWFGTDVTKFGPSNRQQVLLDLPDNSGANNTGYGNPINVDSQSQNTNTAVAGQEVTMVWAAEWGEILMSLTGGQWNAGDSSGEGLSHFCAVTLVPTGYNDYYPGGFAQNWLNGTGTTNQGTATPNAARSDWVNTTFTGTSVGGTFVHGDGDPVSYGCAVAFIYYLVAQLGFSINQVIASYSSNLASCYHTLTGDSSDPFPIFTGLLASVYPPGTPAFIPGPNPENPFPIAEVQFYVQKDTFGHDETQDIINTQSGLISEAFWVAVTGFSQFSFQTLGVTVGAFTGSFAALQGNGIQITPNPAGPQFENGVNFTTPQTIRIPYDLTLTTPFLSQFPATGVSAPFTLSVTLNAGGNLVTGSAASTQFELVAGADPYFTNIDPAQGNQPYLSQDLRVFTAAPALPGQNVPFPNGPTFATDSIAGAYTYIQDLLAYLNSTASFTNPSGTDPFSLLPGQGGEGQSPTSVAPLAINFNGIFPSLANNYNFALARVRLRGTSGLAGQAENVRVFFRVFTTQSNDTQFEPGTYASLPDASGNPGTPVAGANNSTLPFFATGNPAAQTDYQMGGPNIQTIAIPAGRDQTYAYYGCFLNFYDPNYQIGGANIQAFLPGTHHCLVAQIAYDDAPIPTGVSALAWDQLAQRNLQFTAVDNPGPATTHRAPQTFDCKPSGPIGTPGGTGAPPDELMIEWGNVPKGSVAALYWPAVAAADVIALARAWGSTAALSASDAHTLAIPVSGGISYIPIPSGSGQNFAGLFTLDLPVGIVAGQEFTVVVRRLSTKRGQPLPPPPPILQTAPARRAGKGKTSAATHAPAAAPPPAPGVPVWRYVVGSFVVRIPVSTAPALLAPEEMTLAIMKWRLSQLSPSNRWVPVLQRYIAYCAARVDGLGGNAAQVPPSLTYVPPQWVSPVRGADGGTRTRCGKVTEVLYDCHGDFGGFVIDSCCDSETFTTRERGIGVLVMRACADGLRLCVTTDRDCGRITKLAIMP